MEELKVYWAPGCTSCLRMKEFLTRHSVDFTSINISENPAGLQDLAKLGIRSVPIALRGGDWSDGQLLQDLARVAGIQLNSKMLATPELAKRVETFLSKSLGLLKQIPENKLDLKLPNSPRSY